jgi:hypothetical protein
VPRVLSVNVGLPRDVTWKSRTVRPTIWKSPVEGRRMVRKLNIVGDGQGDLAGHGGEHRAAPQSHSRGAGLRRLGIRNSGACWDWRKRATFQSDGRAGLESVIPA